MPKLDDQFHSVSCQEILKTLKIVFKCHIQQPLSFLLQTKNTKKLQTTKKWEKLRNKKYQVANVQNDCL